MKWYVLLLYAFVILIEISCTYQVAYELDNGFDFKKKGSKYRYSAIPIATAGLEVYVYVDDLNGGDSGFISVTRTPFSPKKMNIDTSMKPPINIEQIRLSFPSGENLNPISRYSTQFNLVDTVFSCVNFSTKIKLNKHLYLYVKYNKDSLGRILNIEEKFILTRRKHFEFSMH